VVSVGVAVAVGGCVGATVGSGEGVALAGGALVAVGDAPDAGRSRRRGRQEVNQPASPVSRSLKKSRREIFSSILVSQSG
jgi:hypothetical protein